jgi:superfamily II DNA helicase RecQ
MEGCVIRATVSLNNELLEREDGLGIIYCRDLNMCERLSGFFAQQVIISGDDAIYRPQTDRSFEAWKNRSPGSSRWVVASSCMIAGVHVEGVMAVIFVNIPWSLINLFQGSGRMGRAPGSFGYSLLLSSPTDKKQFDLHGPQDSPGAKAARAYSSPDRCLQLIMTEHLDGRGQDCAALKAVKCSRCAKDEPWVELLDACYSPPLPSPPSENNQSEDEGLEYFDGPPSKS